MKELATGWLFTQGYLSDPNDINTLVVCDDMTDITVQLKGELPSRSSAYHSVTTSGCGGGEVDSLQYFKDINRVTTPLTAKGSCFPEVLSAMFRELTALNSGPGIHCACLARGESFADLLLGYDIGRHNAVDKAIGAGLLADVDFGSTILATSGRVSSDMLLKAAVAGIPIIASQRSVTTLAAQLAASAGIAIVGRLSKPDRVVLGQTDRITD